MFTPHIKVLFKVEYHANENPLKSLKKEHMLVNNKKNNTLPCFFCAAFKSAITVKCLILFTFFHLELV